MARTKDHCLFPLALFLRLPAPSRSDSVFPLSSPFFRAWGGLPVDAFESAHILDSSLNTRRVSLPHFPLCLYSTFLSACVEIPCIDFLFFLPFLVTSFSCLTFSPSPLFLALCFFFSIMGWHFALDSPFHKDSFNLPGPRWDSPFFPA